MLMMLYDSLNLIVSGVKLLWNRKEVESFALQQVSNCVERKMHYCAVLLKDKII